MRVTGLYTGSVKDVSGQQLSKLIDMTVEMYFGSDRLACLDHYDFLAQEYHEASRTNQVVAALRGYPADIMARLLRQGGDNEALFTSDRAELAALAASGSETNKVLARWRLDLGMYDKAAASSVTDYVLSDEMLESLKLLYAEHAHVGDFTELKMWADGRNYVSDGSCLYWALHHCSGNHEVGLRSLLSLMAVPERALGNYRESENRVDLLLEAFTTSDATRLSEIMLMCDCRDVIEEDLPSEGCIAWCSRVPMRLDPYIVAEWRLRGRIWLS